MDTARDRTTGKIVSATELWVLQYVDKDNYECTSCGLTLRPASFKKEINLKRPYFRKDEKTSHYSGCGKTEANKRKADARKGPITGTHGLPLTYPNRLVLDDSYYPAGTWRGSSSGKLPGSRHGNPPLNRSSQKRHDHTTDTIRPIARFYMDFPFDRQNLSLNVPGVEGSTYEQVFQYLYHGESTYYRQPKIFYGYLNFKKTEVYDEFAEVILSAGQWEELDGKNVLTRPYIVRINLTGWSSELRACVLDEIKVTRKEVMDKTRKKKDYKGWFFFLGTQDPLDRFLFHVSDYRLICCISDVMPCKSLNRAGLPALTRHAPMAAAASGLMERQQTLTTYKVETPNYPAKPDRAVTPGATDNRPKTAVVISQAPPVNAVKHADGERSASPAQTSYRAIPHPVSDDRIRIPTRVNEISPPRKFEPNGSEPVTERKNQLSSLSKMGRWFRKLIGG